MVEKEMKRLNGGNKVRKFVVKRGDGWGDWRYCESGNEKTSTWW